MTCSQAKGGDFREEKMAQILKTHVFHVLFYIYFHFNIVFSLLVFFCLAALTPCRKKKALCLTETVLAYLCVLFLQSKQRNTFLDTQLMPLVSKANLNVCCGVQGQPFGALQSKCHRCVTGVTKTRTEVPSPKSQRGTLTGKFLFLLCSRTLWSE